MMRITILCSDPTHPVNPWLTEWAKAQEMRGEIRIVRDVDDCYGGDFLFLISCHQVVHAKTRVRYRHTLVIHASDLPQGRGWSPHIWQIVGGADLVVLSLLEAAGGVDTGRVWYKLPVRFDGSELHDTINARIFAAEMKLMDWALDHCDAGEPEEQQGDPSYFSRRTPEDSRIDPEKSLASQFDLLRVADPHRYPAYFDYRGQRYTVRIETVHSDLPTGTSYES